MTERTESLYDLSSRGCRVFASRWKRLRSVVVKSFRLCEEPVAAREKERAEVRHARGFMKIYGGKGVKIRRGYAGLFRRDVRG